MHFELKSISAESIPEALAKVERYRLLNEPSLAESICLDILAILPDHQQALISLLLARTDQFHSNMNAKAAQDILSQIKASTNGRTTRALSGNGWDTRGCSREVREARQRRITRYARRWGILRRPLR